MRRDATFALIGLFVLSAASAQTGPVLRLDLKEGTATRYAMTVDQEMDMDLGPLGVQTMTMKQRMDLRQTVRERKPDGIHVLEMVYEKVRTEVNPPGGADPVVVEIGPADPTAPPAQDDPVAAMRGILGKPFTVVLSPRGEVMQVAGLDEIFDQAFRLPEDAPPELVKFMDQVRQGMGPEMMETALQQGMAIFPEGPVTIGQGWTQTVAMPNPMIGTVTLAMAMVPEAFESRAGRRAVKLGVTTTMTISGEPPLKEQLQGMFAAMGAPDATLDWRIVPEEGTGAVWLDASTGKTLRFEMALPMGMTMSMSGLPAPEGEPTSFTMAMKIKSRTVLEALD